MLRTTLGPIAFALLLGACASEPQSASPAADDAGDSIATRSTVCDQERTGTHFKRCGRDGVQSMTREEMELARMRAGTVTKEPGGLPGR